MLLSQRLRKECGLLAYAAKAPGFMEEDTGLAFDGLLHMCFSRSKGACPSFSTDGIRKKKKSILFYYNPSGIKVIQKRKVDLHRLNDDCSQFLQPCLKANMRIVVRDIFLMEYTLPSEKLEWPVTKFGFSQTFKSLAVYLGPELVICERSCYLALLLVYSSSRNTWPLILYVSYMLYV